MSKKEFNFTGTDLILLRRFFKKSPKLFGRSVTNTINQVNSAVYKDADGDGGIDTIVDRGILTLARCYDFESFA